MLKNEKHQNDNDIKIQAIANQSLDLSTDDKLNAMIVLGQSTLVYMKQCKQLLQQIRYELEKGNPIQTSKYSKKKSNLNDILTDGINGLDAILKEDKDCTIGPTDSNMNTQKISSDIKSISLDDILKDDEMDMVYPLKFTDNEDVVNIK